MMRSPFSFDEAAFNRLFPFFMLINKDLEVIYMGRSVAKLYDLKKKVPLRNHFSIPRPFTPLDHFNEVIALQNQMVILQPVSDQKPPLRGQLEYLESTEEILFVGSPWFDSVEKVLENHLLLDDFARHDSMIDLLHILKSQEITTDDLKQLLNTVNKQKEELNKANKEISDIALFPTQNPDPQIRINFNGDILRMNPAAEKLSSFAYESREYKPETFWKMISTGLDPTEKRTIVEAISNNKFYSYAIIPIPEYRYYNIYGRDITQQKKIQDELEIQSAVARANENGVVFTDENGVIVWCNEGMKKITGQEEAGIIGKTPVQLLAGPLTDKGEIHKMLDAFYNNRSFKHELIQYRADGSWYWGRTRGQYIQRTDGKKNYFAIIEDITEQKQQEEQIRILSSIAEENTHGVVIADAEGKIEWINKSFEQMTGYTLEEMKGKKPGQLLQGPDTDPQAIAYLKEKIEKGEPFITEILNYTKYKKPYWLRIQGQALKNAEGEIIKYFAIEEDITREKESERRFKLVLENIGDNVWEHDFKTGVTYFSKSDNSFLGYPKDELTNNQQLWWNSVHKDDLKLLVESDRKYQGKESDSHNLEYRIIAKDGTQKWVLDRGVVIEKDQAGHPLRIIGTHTDITNIKQIETELANRVKQFQSLSENIPGVIYEFEFRKDGKEGLRYISPAVEKIFGISREKFKNYMEYIHPDDRELIIEKNKYSRETLEPFYIEARLVVPGQPERWHSVRSAFSYQTEKGDNVFTGFILDITERKKFEVALKANEEKYRGIIANMNLGMIEIDLDRKVTFTNQSMADMVGIPLEDIIGADTNQFLPEESLALVQQKVKDRIEGKSEAFELKVKINSNEKWWLVSSAPRFNEKREFVGTIVICLDINEQKQLESELRIAREQAEQLAQARQNFLANMSHEIRTPMNAIIGMGNQLAKTELTQRQDFFLKTINASAENLLVIINDILDLSKIEAGKLSIEKIGFKPKAVVGAAIQTLIYKAEEKGIKLTNSFCDQRLAEVLIGDPYRLNQILLNLISNAIKFTDTGCVDVKCEVLKDTEATQVIRASVTDTGIGMEKEFVAQLFEKFTQEYDSVTRKYGGSGLGMSITKQLLELMGGRIEVMSEKGKGTQVQFIVEFEKGKPEDLPVSRSYRISKDLFAGKRLLITDDNEMNRLVASTILESLGAEIIEATNGEEAVQKVKEQNPHLVLMDIQMPVMNGYAATMQIRRSGYQTPIIALTANAVKGESEKCIVAGMNDYISKPFKEEDLLKMIAFWLDKEFVLEKTTNTFAHTNQKDSLHYDLTGLKSISKGNDAFVKKMLQLFIEQGPATVREIKQAYEINELEKIKKLAHRLKPSIDNLGIVSIKEEIRDIEKNAATYGQSEQLQKLITVVVTVVENVSHELIDYLKNNSNEN